MYNMYTLLIICMYSLSAIYLNGNIGSANYQAFDSSASRSANPPRKSRSLFYDLLKENMLQINEINKYNN